jgi:hypothetical protein
VPVKKAEAHPGYEVPPKLNGNGVSKIRRRTRTSHLLPGGFMSKLDSVTFGEGIRLNSTIWGNYKRGMTYKDIFQAWESLELANREIDTDSLKTRVIFRTLRSCIQSLSDRGSSGIYLIRD